MYKCLQFLLPSLYVELICISATAPPSNEGENEEEKMKKEIKEKSRREFLGAVQFEGKLITTSFYLGETRY